jgi:hypothetical protein
MRLCDRGEQVVDHPSLLRDEGEDLAVEVALMKETISGHQ